MVEIGPKAFIHLDRIKSNYEKIQKRIGDRIILSVVKANGYGHGAIEIAKELGPGHTIVTILCDSGQRYQSKIWSPDFLKSKDLVVPNWL